jgi:DNA-binding transcriptional ArsR family regulator
LLLTAERLRSILNRMVKYSASLDSTFGALADPTRRAILATLQLGQASITELAKPHSMSLPAVMKHVHVLEQAGLVSQEKTGRTRICRLAAEPFKDAEAWISQYRRFWERNFDSLERYLKEEKLKEEASWQQSNGNKKPNSR